jgi:hypothetical protein
MNFRAQASILAFMACGCAHSPDGSRVSQTTTTGATSFSLPGSSAPLPGSGVDEFAPSSAELADATHPANLLGTAACERKQECDEIGDGKPHASRQACLMTTRRHAHDVLDRLSCDNGLDAEGFDGCVHAVRIAECARVDGVASIDACSPGRVCAR